MGNKKIESNELHKELISCVNCHWLEYCPVPKNSEKDWDLLANINDCPVYKIIKGELINAEKRVTTNR